MTSENPDSGARPSWLPPASELTKMVLDKLVLGLAIALVLLPLQRLQHLNDLETAKVQKVRQFDLTLMLSALSNLAEASFEITDIVLKFAGATDSARNEFRLQFAVTRARAENALSLNGALTDNDSNDDREFRKKLREIEAWLRSRTAYDEGESKELASSLQKLFANYLRTVRKHVNPPKI